MIAFQAKVNEPFPTVTDEITGGTEAGLTPDDTSEYELVPAKLTAATLK